MTHGLSLTIQVMNNYKALWLGQADIRQIINTLREINTQIDLLSSLLIEGNVHTETLQMCKQQMALQAVTLAESIATGLSQQQTPSTKRIMMYTYTDIYLAPPKTALNRCQEIYQIALQLLPALHDYGLRISDAEQLNNAVILYQVNLQKEIVTKQDLTTYTYTLAKLHQEAETLLQNRLDHLIAPYAETYPEFFAAYQQSRIQEPF
jgi:hypothetical protein